MKTKDVLPPIKAPSDVLTFGKYKNRTIEHVLGYDPGYIVWLVVVENEICEVSDEIYNDAQMYERLDNEYEFPNGMMPRTYGDLD